MLDGEEGVLKRVDRSRRRLRWFGIHLLTYFLLVATIAIANLLFSNAEPWFIFPMVFWGAPLAVHAAFAMGLLDTLLRVK